ncbi:hypothetical protein IEQ34_009986 [Dendrobium chrysotoxum]|uniref:Uncharacterized protein n=1 Tax=Dendrobium chrysotoxum TaxID=161865 RepID=A0AAV7H1X6_DENCH|nr:hypothetical protein IEQ34_009986 [Dendrobium chrysotoxum]
MYKKAEASFWIAKEVNLSQDLHQWDQSLKSGERHFVTHVLAFFNVAVSLLDSKLADGIVLICGVAQTMCAVGKKMAFLVVRQITATVQCVLTMIEELVSTQMVKFTTSLSRESIMDIKGKATERLEALYPTLKELALTSSPGSHHRPLLPGTNKNNEHVKLAIPPKQYSKLMFILDLQPVISSKSN